MILTINSAYPAHETAKELLAMRGVQLNIIPSKSPFVLATSGKPDVVIHPLSKIINGEFPSIRFCGPDCKFPNYEYIPQVGFSEIGLEKEPAKKLKRQIVLINTINDIAMIKYLESLGPKLIIYGKPCSSLYYYGPLKQNSYELYKESDGIAVDNEAEALKALFTKRINLDNKDLYEQNLISGFDYTHFANFRQPPKAQRFDKLDEFLESRNWNNIFNNLFKEIGITNGESTTT